MPRAPRIEYQPLTTSEPVADELQPEAAPSPSVDPASIPFGKAVLTPEGWIVSSAPPPPRPAPR